MTSLARRLSLFVILVAALLSSARAVSAQIVAGIVPGQAVATLPASCGAAGQPYLVFLTTGDAPGLYQCIEASTWTPVRAGTEATAAESITGQWTYHSDLAIESSDLAAPLTGAWTLGTGWTEITPGHFQHTPGSTAALSRAIALEDGTAYHIAFAVTGMSAGTLVYRFGGETRATLTEDTEDDGYIDVLRRDDYSAPALRFTPTSDFDGTVTMDDTPRTGAVQPLPPLSGMALSAPGASTAQQWRMSADINTDGAGIVMIEYRDTPADDWIERFAFGADFWALNFSDSAAGFHQVEGQGTSAYVRAGANSFGEFELSTNYGEDNYQQWAIGADGAGQLGFVNGFVIFDLTHGVPILRVDPNDGDPRVLLALPGEDPEVSGALWNDGGTVKVSAGA